MKKETPKPASTAARLRELQRDRVRVTLFFAGLIYLGVLVAGWCYIQDSAYTGVYNIFELPGLVTRSVRFNLIARGGQPVSVAYIISAPDLPPRTVDATVFFFVGLAGALAASLLTAFVAWMLGLVAEGQIKSRLKPLYSLAERAMELSGQPQTAPQKRIKPQKATPEAKAPNDADSRIHSLETAIDSIKAERPDAVLHVGDPDLKGLEDAVNSLLARTRESYSQQIRFVSDASHELRTPIAVIKGYTDMLDRWGKRDEKILGESIDAIKAETDHMNKLVEQLLFLARGDSGRTRLTIEKFSLSDMVREVYEESVMIDASHKWEVYAEGEIIAEGDPAMLKQATRILVDNAAKYTPEGEMVMLKATVGGDGGPAVVVQDNGIGIGGEDMSHIFDRFYRSDPARGREKGGTGLGLAIAKWIVDRHDGYFEIVSRREFGTRITMHLPSPSGEEAQE